MAQVSIITASYNYQDYIKEAKKRRQIILVSHNPNIVVGCDSEEVIIAQQKNKKFYYRSGSLENSYLSDKNSNITPETAGIRENVLDERIKEIIVPAYIFEESGEEMPLVGDYQVLTAEDGSALAILKIKKTEVAPYSLFENDTSTVIGNVSDDDIVIKIYFEIVFR